MSVNLTDVMAPCFYDVHNDIKAGKHREYWLKGGRGSTKSSFVGEEIIQGMMRDHEANAIVYRRVGNTLFDSVYSQLLWVIEKFGWQKYFICKRTPMEIIIKNTGQKIMFRGADDPLKSKSIKLSKGYFRYLWFEELAEFRSPEDIRSIKQSVIRGKGNCITLCSYNPPKTASSWVNEEVLKEDPDRYVHHSTYLDVPKEWLGEDFISNAEMLKLTNPRAYENEYLGEITGTGGSVFTNLELRDIPDDEIMTFGAIYQGIDWGFFPDPFQWVRCCYDPARRILYIFDEYRTFRTGNAGAYEAIQDRLSSDESLIADSAEKKSIADFHEYGAWWIRGAAKGPGSVAYSTKWLAALAGIVIDPKRCPESAKEFRAYEFERNAAGEFYNGFPDKNNHAIDAVRYALSNIWRRKGE